MPGVSVRIFGVSEGAARGGSLTTGSDGAFDSGELPPGRYQVDVIDLRDNFRLYTQQVTLPEGERVEVRF